MQNLSLISQLIILLILYSCNKGMEGESLKVISHFSSEISLKGQPISDIQNNFYPRQMGIFENQLVLCDWDNSPYFHVYELPSLSYIGNFGIQGRGPGEYLDPLFWGQFQQEDSLRMWVYQMNVNILSLVNIEQSLSNIKYQPQIEITMPSEIQSAVNVLALGHDLIVGSGISSDGEFFFFYPESDVFIWKDFSINYTRDVNSFFGNNIEYIALLKQGVTKVKPDGTRFAKAMIYTPIIDVYYPDGEKDFSIVLNNFIVPDFRDGDFNPDTKVWYENIYLTDNYIYALHRNCSIRQYSAGECKNVEIHVFNWKGEPIKKLLMNQGIAPAAPFAVDELNQMIYSLNFDDSEEFFFRFNLNK